MRDRRLIPGLVVALTCIGCADTQFVHGDGTDGPVRDAFVLPDRTPAEFGICDEVIDLVLVLDLSSSMRAVLNTLSTDIDRVVNASNALKPNAQFGLVAFVDNVKLDDSGPREGGRVHVEAATLQKAFRHYLSTYTDHNRNPGDGPNGPTTQNPICEENAIDALYEAAEAYPWREGSTRVVILATDDTFLERPDNYGDRDGDGKTDKRDFPSEGDYPARRAYRETVELLVKKKIRVFSFTRLQPPGPFDPLRCGTGRRLPWGAVSAGWSTPYKGDAPMPQLTGGQNFDLVQILGNQLSLTETINNVVLESRCRVK